MSIADAICSTPGWSMECADAGAILPQLPDQSAKLIMVDPPWRYGAGRKGHGRAAEHYKTLPMSAIAKHIAESYRVATDPGYLIVWITFPNVRDWFRDHSDTVEASGWRYSTGGAWGKTTGQGIGYYAWGDAEEWMLYTKGKAVPPAKKSKPSNLQLDSLLLTPRFGQHSFKPVHFIDRAVECYTNPCDLILDFYAGSSGYMGQICLRLNRRYLGIEIDPKRCKKSIEHMEHQELELLYLK